LHWYWSGCVVKKLQTMGSMFLLFVILVPHWLNIMQLKPTWVKPFFIVLFMIMIRSSTSTNTMFAPWSIFSFEKLLTTADLFNFQQVSIMHICGRHHWMFYCAVMVLMWFSSFLLGMFVLYDSTQRFFTQLMMAKNAQSHSNEHRSGYIRRLRHFALDSVKSIFRILSRRKSSVQSPFIYLRGDESSHFRERGNKHDRRHVYPA